MKLDKPTQSNKGHDESQPHSPSESTELKEGYIKVQLDYAPKTNGKKFAAWCEKYGFTPIGSGRRAWCSSLSTYFRDASGVAFSDGEMLLFYEEDLVDLTALIDTQVREAKEAEHEETLAMCYMDGFINDATREAYKSFYPKLKKWKASKDIGKSNG